MAFVPSRKPKPLPKRKTRHLDAPKPPWDDSVTDLDVYRSSNEELLRRKQVTKPPDNSRDQLKSKFLSGDKKFANSAVLREILFAHNDIEDVLAESDKTMSLVQDLFGENPGKYSGISTVTPAPNFGGKNGNPGFSRLPYPMMSANSEDDSENELPMTDLYSERGTTFTESHDVLSGVTGRNNNFDTNESLLDLERYKKLLQKTENDLRKLNNGVLKPTSQVETFSSIQDAMSTSGESLSQEQSNVAVNNTTEARKITRVQAPGTKENAPSIENVDNMKVILGAIEELKTAVLGISQDNKSGVDSPSGAQSASFSEREIRSNQSNQSLEPSSSHQGLTQLNSLKNLMPLLAQRNSGASWQSGENTCSNTTFSGARNCQVNDISSTSNTAELQSSGVTVVSPKRAEGEFDTKGLKTFDQLVNAVKYLSDEQTNMKRKLNERDCLINSMQQKIERQNSTIRALAEDIIQLQMVMAQWCEVHSASNADGEISGNQHFSTDQQSHLHFGSST